ncbi:MAG: hypothetical protein J0I11_19720 [Actinobacteria bacterium]|jgi:signal transduction histidine kinase|nr:hypothetical protein [Actinomycetota bacterium]
MWATGLALYAARGEQHPGLGDGATTDAWLLSQLRAAAIPVQWYVGFRLVLEVLLLGTTVTVAAVLLAPSAPRRRQSLLAICLLAVGLAASGAGYTLFTTTTGSPDVARAWAAAATLALLAVLHLLPSGRLAAGWTRWPVVGAGILALIVVTIRWTAWERSDLVLLAVIVLLTGTAGASLVTRIRTAPFVERQQTKWIALAMAGRLVYFVVLAAIPPGAIESLPGSGGVLVISAMLLFSYLLHAAMCMAIVVAVLRRGLFVVDVWIARAIACAALTAGIVGVYVAAVVLLGSLAPGSTPLFTVVATALVAAAFLPAYRMAVRAANRLVYGRQRDPYALVTVLGRRLEQTVAPGEVAELIIDTIVAAVAPARVSVVVHDVGVLAVRSESGVAAGVDHPFQIAYEGEVLGELTVAARDGTSLRPRDLGLLSTVAGHAGRALAAAAMDGALRAAQERAIDAAKRERVEVHRELHDGIAPLLASAYQRIELAGHGEIPEEEAALLRGARDALTEVIGQVRSLVIGLRPPLLEDVGLEQALRQRFASIPPHPPLHLVADLAHEPPRKVSEAVYWMVLEAVANARRHADAQRCGVVLATTPDGIRVTVSDDGRGGADPGSGGGMRIMRDRIESLGGVFRVSSGAGTVVTAELPGVWPS